MNISGLHFDNRVLRTDDGETLGTSYRWPGGQYCAIHTAHGLIGCGIYDCSIASHFGMLVAIARGTPEVPLVEPEDLLQARIAEVSKPARLAGISVGMTGREALRILMKLGLLMLAAMLILPDACAQAVRVNPPAPPKNVRHTASSPAHLRIEWEDVATDEAGYRIWRREVGGEWYLAGATGPNATHFDDGGMQELTAYEHKVAAFNAVGEGSESVTLVATKTQRMEPHLKPEIIFPADTATFCKVPGAVELKSGELLLSYDKGDTAKRRSRAGDSLWLVTSSNQRNGWSSPRELMRGDAEIVFGKSSLVRIADGRLGMAFSRWTCDEKGIIINRQRQFIASVDEGLSWSQPVDIGPYSANNQTLIVANGGRLLEALSDTTGVAKIYASDDNGGSWQLAGSVSGKRLGEAALANLGNDRVVFLSRHEWPFYRLSYSQDNGTNWEKTDSLLHLGGGDNPPKLILLPDGQTLAAIVHSWYPGKKAKDRRQLASMISRDGGRTWDNFRLIGFAPNGDDGFLQHSVMFIGDTAWLFYGAGSRLDTNDGKDLRVIRLSSDFFTSTAPWPYDWQGRKLTASLDVPVDSKATLGTKP